MPQVYTEVMRLHHISWLSRVALHINDMCVDEKGLQDGKAVAMVRRPEKSK